MRDAYGEQRSSKAVEALPEDEEMVVLVVLMVGVRGMLVVGTEDGDEVMEGRTGGDKSKDTAETEGPKWGKTLFNSVSEILH